MMFISFPTGFGISLCYIMLPLCFDARRGVKNKSMILVVFSFEGLNDGSGLSYAKTSAFSSITDKECATKSPPKSGESTSHMCR